jgi:MFS family permease
LSKTADKAAGDGPLQLSTRQLIATVAMTLAVQSLASMAMAVPAVLAPVAAADFGYAPTAVGVLVSWTYITAMLSGLAGGALLGRYGPVRLFQFTAVVMIAGLALGASANILLVFLALTLIGGANGVINPTSSHILARAAPPEVRVMVFSIKQTGVPLGAAMSGVLLPALLLVMHWPVALLVIAVAFAVLIPFLQPFRKIYDGGRAPAGRFGLSAIFLPLAEVWSDRRMRELAIGSAVYASVQLCLLTYLVSYLKLELDYSLVLAGLVYSVAGMTGVFARIVWGMVADRLFKPRHVLAGLGIAMSVFGFVVASFDTHWSVAAVMVVAALYAATAAAWNGVFLAEVARMSAPGRVAAVTGGSQVFTFAGSMFGPPIFGAVVSASGSYAHGYILFAVLPLLMGLQLLRAPPPARMNSTH